MKILLPVALGLLAVPRAVLHDLDVLHEGTGLNAAFVVVPLVVWVVVAAFAAANPFVTLVVAGAVYGVGLAVVHNVFWNVDSTAAPEILLRGAATASSIVTGLAVGVVCGGLAWALKRVAAGR